MAETEQTESVGAALARMRWAKTPKADRQRVAKMLVDARRRKARRLGKVGSKRPRKAAAKS